PPKFLSTIGPSFILLGLALGSGELIMWPFLSAVWGMGLMWGAFLGISFQYVLNAEIMRYSLAKGESVFVGLRKMAPWLPVWFILSTFIPWSLPGFSSASSQIFANIFHLSNVKILAIVFLLVTGVVLTLGKTLYHTMEYFQKGIIIIGLPVIVVLVVLVTKRADWVETGLGLIGKGDGWWFFPPGVALASFLGAFAYSGAGGNLNFAQSYYIKEKGFGMGKFTDKITSLFSPGKKVIKIEGSTFDDNNENFVLWKKWWRLVSTEHFIVFWFIGLITIILLSVLAKSLVFGSASQSGIDFLYQQSSVLTSQINPVFGIAFLVVAALMLFSTQIGVLESSSRIISENYLLIFYKKGFTANPSLAFYIALWGQIALGIVVLLFGFQEPRSLLTLSAILNAIAMMFAFPLVFLLNRKNLKTRYRASFPAQIFFILGFVFFVVFVVMTLRNFFL
ncbi:MAG: Nramp family divalent metal transporter, partial [bacterium]|nr:Nramp family divalent metal transporter [bacterium]